MIRYAPDSAMGGGGNSPTNLDNLSVDELQERVHDLESQIDTMRRRHQAETRRSMETVEKLQKKAPHRSEASAMQATQTHADGYDVLIHQRVAVLIDVQNMYYAARNLYNSKLEFSKLLGHLTRKRKLCRAIAYIVERPGMEQEKFVEVLRRNGYEVRKKLLIERSDGSQKGDWDLGMALDAVAMADKVDVVVLVTGDGDFVTLTHYLHSRGVRVEVASFPETTALELIRSCDTYHRLNEKVLLPSGQFSASEPEPEAEESEEPAQEPEPEATAPASTPPRHGGSAQRPAKASLGDLDDDDHDFSL